MKREGLHCLVVHPASLEECEEEERGRGEEGKREEREGEKREEGKPENVYYTCMLCTC